MYNLCLGRLVGSPTRKHVLLHLASRADPDGRQIFLSKPTIAAFSELGLSSVKREIRSLLDQKILTVVGRKKAKNGFVINYSISISEVEKLPLVRDLDDDLEGATGPSWTGSTVDGDQSDLEKEARVDGRSGPDGPPILPKYFPEPPTRAGEPNDLEFEEAWKAYPEDRRRGRTTCQRAFLEAAQSGVSSPEIIAAIRGYARDTNGHTRHKVCFSDNWFRDARWEFYVARQRQERQSKAMLLHEQNVRISNWIKEKDNRCRFITKPQIMAALESGLLDRMQISAAEGLLQNA